MSISNQTDKIFGTGDGSTTVFSFPFKIFAATDLVVYEINTTVTPNISYTKVLTTDYSVSINTVGEGGTITFVVAPPLNWQTLIQRVEPFTQSLVLNTEGNLPAQQIGNQLDLMTMLCIQVNEAVSRCPQLPVTYIGSLPIALPIPQAGLVLMWDPTGSFLVNGISTAIGTVALPLSNGNIAPLLSANLANGSSFYGLGNIPAGAGVIPVANIPTGITADKVLQLNGSAEIPAVSGALLTGLTGSQITSLLGSGVSKNASTTYQAATDGFIVANTDTAGGSLETLQMFLDAVNGTTKLIDELSQGTESFVYGMLPVPKGYYYKMTGTPSTYLFFPLGS